MDVEEGAEDAGEGTSLLAAGRGARSRDAEVIDPSV